MQFYDDPADEINKGEGSVLPLWVFKCEEFDGCCVTSIHFSPSYPDMVGVSHGTCEAVILSIAYKIGGNPLSKEQFDYIIYLSYYMFSGFR